MQQHKILTPYIQRMRNETPIFHCELLADTHQMLPMQNKQLKAALNDMEDRNIQHVFLCGDLTNNGYRFQFKSLFSLLMKYPFDYQFALGNHDIYNLFHKHAQKIPHELKLYVYQKQLYQKIQYPHVSLYTLHSQSPQKNNMVLGHDQLSWLDKELKQDQSTWKLIMCHQPLADTHPNSDTFTMHIGKQSSELEAILRKYQHVVFLSGHLHNSFALQSMYLRHQIICVNIPGFHDIDQGLAINQIGVQLYFFDTFIFMVFRDYQHVCDIDSVFYVYDALHDKIIKEYAT